MSMFGGKKEGEASASSSAGTAKGTNIIIEGTEITGNIKAHSDLRIDGVLEGNLECAARLLLGKKGVVRGDIKSKQAIIEGTITGNLQISAQLHVKESAKIHGDIITEKLIVDGGAQINGSCKMGSGSNAKVSNVQKQNKAS